MRQSTVDMLDSVGLGVDEVRDIVLRALAEDLGPDGLDVTSAATVASEARTVFSRWRAAAWSCQKPRFAGARG